MKRAVVDRLGRGFPLVAAVVALVACDRSATGPTGPCYTVNPLHATGAAASDTVAAHAAFTAYLTYLMQTDGYPVLGWSVLEYRRAVGTESCRGTVYWGIAACGVHVDGDSVETTMFRVREDGTVVAMLGCI